MMTNKPMLQKAKKWVSETQVSVALRAMADKAETDNNLELREKKTPTIPIRYVEGKPQINETMAVFTGLIDRIPDGPRTDEKGSSPDRQRKILQTAIPRVIGKGQNQHRIEDTTP